MVTHTMPSRAKRLPSYQGIAAVPYSKVLTPSATLPRTSPYCVLTTIFIGLPPSKRVARRGVTSENIGCVWGRNGKNQEGSFVLLLWQSIPRGVHLLF